MNFMIVIVGESASGKSTVEKCLVNQYSYSKIVSYTTREPRVGEIDGEDYHFITPKDFIKMIENNEFAEYACYNGWYYGTAKKDCTDDKVIVCTPHGLRQLKKNPELNVTSFYIHVTQRDRLIKILQRGDDIIEAIRRNLTDVGMFDGIEDEVDCVISNNHYERSAVSIAHEIISKLEE